MKVKDLVFVALFAALTAVLSLISIPMPGGVPITLQTFAVALCGYMLGMWRGTLAVGIYIAIGAVGIPVFAGFRGGVSVLVGATGGFIFGFLFFALLCGLGMEVYKGKNHVIGTVIALAIGFGGLMVCHVLGGLQFGAVTGRKFGEAFLLACLPYIPKDAVSLVLAYALAKAVRVRAPKLIGAKSKG